MITATLFLFVFYFNLGQFLKALFEAACLYSRYIFIGVRCFLCIIFCIFTIALNLYYSKQKFLNVSLIKIACIKFLKNYGFFYIMFVCFSGR